MSHSPSPSSGHASLYPESELEHTHSRTPSSSGGVTLSPIPSSRSSPFSHPASPLPASAAPSSPSSFVSFTSIPADSSDDPLTSVSSSSVDAEELTRQSLGGSRTASPRLPHSALSPHAEATLFPSSPPASPSPFALDPTIVDIIARTRQLEEQSASAPSATSSSPSSSAEQSAVVYSAGLLQLSQRLQELQHPLSKRLMLSFGAASGQMKSADYVGCVVTCRRAIDCLELWPQLSSSGEKDGMAQLLKLFKASFTSTDPLHCRLLYVELFLSLSALLLPSHAEWAMALQSSAQKGLKASPQEAIKSMTKITKLLFTAGLSKPPSAYKSRGAAHHMRGATVGMDRVERVVDVRAVEVEQAVRMMGRRQAKAEEKRTGEEDAALTVEEKRLNEDDVDLVYLALGVSRERPALEKEGKNVQSFDAAAVQEQLAKVTTAHIPKCLPADSFPRVSRLCRAAGDA